MVKKEYFGNECFGLARDHIKLCQTNLFITTKTIKVSFVIYSDTDPLLEKIDSCHNNPEKSSTAKLSKHTACCYSLFTQ